MSLSETSLLSDAIISRFVVPRLLPLVGLSKVWYGTPSRQHALFKISQRRLSQPVSQ